MRKIILCLLLAAAPVGAQSASPGAPSPAAPSPAPTASAAPASAAAPAPAPAAPSPSPEGPAPTLEELQARIAKDPRDVSSLRALGTAYRKQGKENDALPLLLHACHLAPKDPRIRAQLAMTLKTLNKPKASRAQYEKLKLLNPALAERVLPVLAQ